MNFTISHKLFFYFLTLQLSIPIISNLYAQDKNSVKIDEVNREIQAKSLSPHLCHDHVKNTDKSLSSYEESLAGASAGVMNSILVHPLVTIKNHLQVGKKTSTKTSFYRGLPAKLMEKAPSRAIMFGVNGAVLNHFKDDRGNVTQSEKLIAGTSAGVISAIPKSFFDLIMVRQQLQSIKSTEKIKPTFINILRNVVKEEGLRGLSKGMSATVLREGIYAPSVLVLPAIVQNNIFPETFNKENPTLSKNASLCLSGMFASLSNQWVDTCKTRIQNDTDIKHKGVLATVQKVIKEEGFKTLYKGTVPRMTNIAIGSVVTINAKNIISEYMLKSKNENILGEDK